MYSFPNFQLVPPCDQQFNWNGRLEDDLTGARLQIFRHVLIAELELSQ